MRMTEAGLALIKRFEGYRGEAYLCPAGVWTIGYGHTSVAGNPAVTRGAKMNREEAARVLAADVEIFADGVRAALTREVTAAQFSALVSFAYNVGIGGFRSSSVLKAVNAGDFDAVPRRLGLWVKGGGRVLPGLVKRRAAEAELFISGGPASLGAERWPEPIKGKPPRRSTTVIAAAIAAIAAVFSGGSGLAGGGRAVLVILGVAGLAAALWIIRERIMKSKEEGV